MIKKAFIGVVLWYVGGIVYDLLPDKFKPFSKGSDNDE